MSKFSSGFNMITGNGRACYGAGIYQKSSSEPLLDKDIKVQVSE